MLRHFSGQTHSVYSGVAIRNLTSGRERVWWVRTRVTFRPLSPQTIRCYFSRVNPLDKAGGYAIQDGRELVHSIRGPYTNVMGLPLERLREELNKLGLV